MQISVQRSDQSILIQYSRYTILIKGFKIKKIQYHGLNKQSFGSFVDHLSKYVNFLTIKFNSKSFLLFCGFVVKPSEYHIDKTNKLQTIISNLANFIPYDLDLIDISGYELPILFYDNPKFRNGFLQIDNNNKLLYHQIIFKQLRINGNVSKFIQGIFEETSATLTVTINSINSPPKCHLSISLIDQIEVNIKNSNNKIKNFLSQIPNISGELTYPTPNHYKKNPLFLMCGVNQFSLPRHMILQICEIAPQLLTFSNSFRIKPVYNLIKTAIEVKNSNFIKSKLSSQQKNIENSKFHLTSLTSKLNHYNWQIEKTEQLTKNLIKIFITKFGVRTCILYSPKINQNSIDFIHQNFSSDEEMPLILLYKGDKNNNIQFGKLAFPVLSIEEIILI